MSSAKKKAAIALDTWKLSIFERHLKQGGYSWTNVGELTPGALILTVETESLAALFVVVQAALREAEAEGPRH